jgi:hypothetical protein
VPVKLNGLPAHILLVHAVLVLVPLAAAMLLASAIWPAARAKLGFLTPAVALVALGFVPIATNAGKWLRDHLQNNRGNTDPAIIRHTHLGGHLWPWALALFVVSATVWWLGRRYELSWRPAGAQPEDAAVRQALPVWLVALVAAAAVVVSVGTVVELYRIGDSGSKAVWTGLTNG